VRKGTPPVVADGVRQSALIRTIHIHYIDLCATVAAESNGSGWGVPLRLEDDLSFQPFQLADLKVYLTAARKHNQETEERRDAQKLHKLMPSVMNHSSMLRGCLALDHQGVEDYEKQELLSFLMALRAQIVTN
jgi:hypothetical protein